MAGYVQLRRKADRLSHEGDSMGALALYRRLLEVHPHDHAVRLHAGDALARLGLRRRAGRVYAATALAHLRGGRPLQGVAACCALLGVEPDAEGVLGTLADMYGKASPRVKPGTVPPTPPAPPTGPVDAGAEVVAPLDLIRAVSSLATKQNGDPEPDELAALPIFSQLGQEDLLGVLERVIRRRFRDGEPLMRQGDAGESFFLLAHGGARVSRTEDGEERPVAVCGPGSILGEIALVTRAPRTATVTALGDVDAVEVPVRALAAIAGDRRSVADVLDAFSRDRLVRTVITGSRVFRPFLPERMGEILPLFTSRDVPEGASILVEGQVGQGLFIVVSGELSVSHTDGRAEVELARVGPGDVLGETSLLGDTPGAATVTATRTTMTMFLDRDAFDALVARYPAVRDQLERLGEERGVVNAFLQDEEAFLASADAEDPATAEDFYL